MSCAHSRVWVFVLRVILWIVSLSLEVQGTTDGCAVKLCGGTPRPIVCHKSRILIENVTSSRPEDFRETTAQNIRRMCMGVRQCNPDICDRQDGERLKIKYVCVKDEDIKSSCEPWAVRVDGNAGFIRSLNYPAAASKYSACRWRIYNSPTEYTILRIHDLQTNSLSPICKTGLKIRGDKCERTEGTEIRVCHGQKNSTIKICGTVGIDFTIDNDNGARFWLSYEVREKETDDVEVNALEKFIQPCGSNVMVEKTDIFGRSETPTITTPIYDDKKNSSSDNITIGVMPPEKKEENQSEASDTNLIVIIVVVAIVIIIIINLTAVIIFLRRRARKQNEATNASNRRNNAVPYYIGNVPVHDRPPAERPTLGEGYSKVADEIPYTEGSGSYAEVNEQPDIIPKLPSRPPDVNRRRMKKRPVQTNAAGRHSVQSQGSERTASPTGSVTENIYEEIEETDDNGRNQFRNCTLPLTHHKTQPAMRPKSVATLRSKFEREINNQSNNNENDKNSRGLYLKPSELPPDKIEQQNETEALLQKYSHDQHPYFELDKHA